MAKRIFIIAWALSFFWAVQGPDIAQADPVSLPLNALCCEKRYPVYGDEQPSAQGEGCSVSVDLEALLTEQELQEGPDESTGLNPFAGFGGAAESLASPLGALYEGLGIKKPFVDLMNALFKGHTEEYHAFLDEEVFGQAIASISQYSKAEKLAAYLKEEGNECDADNPKPNCVIERALCSYEKYTGVLFHQAGQNLSDQAVSGDDVQAVLAVLQQRDAALFQEAVHAQEALDTAIAVYAQFFQTYRLHLKLTELIESLVKVRDMTGFMRTLVGCVPNKFVGSATTKCN